MSGPRTVDQVMAERKMAMLGGCCNRFAEQSPCWCLEEAEAYEDSLAGKEPQSEENAEK